MCFEEITKEGVLFTRSPAIHQSGQVAHGFSTRIGGVSQGIYESLNLGFTRGDDPEKVAENYRRFFSAVDCNPSQFVMTNQVHGDVVRAVTTADLQSHFYPHEGYKPQDFEADGLITDLPGVALVIFGADCLPILFHDPVRRVIAACHAGWRGTASGIAERVVEKMAFYGCKPEDIRAALGPAIGQCCFETHEDVPNAMTSALGVSVTPYIRPGEPGKFHVDLKGINQMRLTRKGLLPEHIDCTDHCTACDANRYWSHRVTQGQRGSQAAVIQLG